MTPDRMRALADLGPMIHVESWDTICGALRFAADRIDGMDDRLATAWQEGAVFGTDVRGSSIESNPYAKDAP